MKRIRAVLSGLIVVLCAVSYSSHALAQDLEISDVAAFLNVQDAIKPIDEELRATGEVSIFRPKALDLAQTMLPAYEKNIETLKSDNSEFYARMSDVATGYIHENTSKPYASLEDWAKMGDRVMIAFYAANTEDGSASEAKAKFEMQMPPEVIPFLPAETKAMLEGLMSSLESIENVSDHDKQVVRQFEKQIALHLADFSDGYVVNE